MTGLVGESWLLLLYLDWIMRCRAFKSLHEFIRAQQVRTTNSQLPPDQLCQAVDIACALYFKRVLCLQRSAVTTMLLRRHGWCAELVIGAQVVPFKSHAWVEIDNRVVNDKPYMRMLYGVLDRC